MIEAALQERLALVDAHPESATPAADEARLALHVAAARLLEPQARAARVLAGPTQPQTTPNTHARNGASRPTPARQHADLRPLVNLAVASCGGWNARAKRRVAAVAAARRVPLAEALRAVSRPIEPAPPEPRPTPHPQAASPTPVPDPLKDALFEDPEPTERRRGSPLLLILTLLAIASLTPVAVYVFDIPNGFFNASNEPEDAATSPMSDGGKLSPQNSAKPALAGPSESSTANTPASPTAEPSQSPAVNPAHASTLQQSIDELRAAASEHQFDRRAGLTGFTRANAALASRWPDLPPLLRRAAIDDVIEFVYVAASDPAAADDALAAIARPLDRPSDDNLWPVLWSAGLLARLQRERDLPASFRRDLDRRLDDAVGGGPSPAGSFEAGAIAAMHARLERFAAQAPPQPDHHADDAARPAGPEAFWRRWTAAADALLADQPAAHAALLTQALSALLAVEPTSEQLTSISRLRTPIRVLAGVEVLAASVPWNDQPAAQSWLMRTLASTSADRDRLVALASAVSDALAPEVPRTATPAELHASLFKRWNADSGAAGPTDALARAVDRAITPPRSDRTPIQSLASAVTLARLNAAAALLWSGENETAAALIADASRPADDILSPTRSPSGSAWPRLGRGAWALRYLQAGANVPLRTDLLAQLAGRSSDLDRVDADLLVTEALRGTPRTIRQKAAELALARADDPAIIGALVDHLHAAPRTAHTAELIEAAAGASLPPLDDTRWRRHARRALVARQLERLAGQTDGGRIDRLAAVLTQAYARRVDPTDLASAQEQTAQLPSPADPTPLADLLRHRWIAALDLAPPSPPVTAAGQNPLPTAEGAEARLAARLQLASGTVQTFAARQAAIVETAAATIARERHGLADHVREILTDFAAARRDAQHVFDQIAAAEAALARLWLVRLDRPLNQGDAT